MPKRTKAFKLLIVGQGVAGSLLALESLRRGFDVQVIDNHHNRSSSRVAAGLIQPIAGKRFVPTAGFNQLYARALSMYRYFENVLDVKFFHERPILRLFREDDPPRFEASLNKRPALRNYLSVPAPPLPPGIRAPWGSFGIQPGGYCDLPVLMDAARSRLAQEGRLISAKLDYSELDVTPSRVHWKGSGYDLCVFCEGFQARQNPWLKHLRWNFARGDIISGRIEKGILPKSIVHAGTWLIPLDDRRFRAGATYDRETVERGPSPQGREEILKGLEPFFDHPLIVTGQQSGIRPLLLELKPVAQALPGNPSLAVLNGLGSRGVLLAPTLVDSILPPG